MGPTERRRYRRLRIRLPIVRIEGHPSLRQAGGAWTVDVSAGGVYFPLRSGSPPARGAKVSLELLVPPGVGYSGGPGQIRGTGRVVRATALPDRSTGVAVRFTKPLQLLF